MLDNSQTLHVSPEELEVIEAALETQSQILNVQADAGGQGARERLNAVKRLLASLSQQRPSDAAPKVRKPCRAGFFSHWLGLSQKSY